jgi:hypothetical protein
LRDVKLLGRPGNVLAPGDFAEVSQLVQIHSSPLINDKLYIYLFNEFTIACPHVIMQVEQKPEAANQTLSEYILPERMDYAV